MNHVLKRTLTGLAVGAGVIAIFLWCPLRAVTPLVVVLSALVQLEFYQMAKVPPGERDAFIAWQADFEYDKLGLPRPDAVLYLDVEPEVSQRLMEKRYGGDNSKKDLHESNLRFLLSCRESALYAAEHCGWTMISCCEVGDIKPIEVIAEEIEKALKNIL